MKLFGISVWFVIGCIIGNLIVLTLRVNELERRIRQCEQRLSVMELDATA